MQGETISQKLKINREIRASQVRLIDEAGVQHGVVSLAEAILKAENAGLDLVEVSPKADTPVCRIMDWGKYRYDQEKKLQKSKKTQKNQQIKGIRLSVKIGRHDFETKLTRATDFLSRGNKLALQLRFKGREMAHPELGEKVLREFAAGLEGIVVEQEPKLQGRSMNMTLSQKKQKGSDEKQTKDA